MKVSSDILSLTPYRPGKPIAEAKRELGLNTVYKLASNENPLGPSPAVVTAIQAELGELHRYPDAACFEMLEAYSQHLKVGKEQIACGNGSNELIDLLIRIYCEPGDAILTSQAAFIAYKIGAQAARVRTVETALTQTGGYDLQAMSAALQKDEKIRLIFIANPNNPTGTYVTQKELEIFLSECAKRQVLVILDEAYVEFVRAKDYVSGLSLRQKFQNLVVLRTMSKVYGLAGLRVGFAIAAPEVIDLLNRVRNPFNVNQLAQVATVAALKDQGHVRRVLEMTHKGLDALTEAAQQLQLPFFQSQANFLLIDCLQDSEKVFNALLRRGVITRPVKNYGLMTHLRISVGLEEENQAAITGLKAILNS
ncbi:MAG: histidinol-phosphate transaminase [Bdellovibrionales bacterium]